MTIMVVDDERKIVEIISSYLRKEGFDIIYAFNGEEALKKFEHSKIDLIILDWMIPQINGIDVCKYIKNINSCKIIMLTAKTQTDDELNALNIGADDYVKKPFDIRVLMMRVRKLLGVDNEFRVKDIKLNIKNKQVYKGDNRLILTRIEFNLLSCFIKNKGIILSRDRIIDLVWGAYDGDYRTVDTHIRRLRSKIGDNIIKTYRGMGYSIEGDLD